MSAPHPLRCPMTGILVAPRPGTCSYGVAEYRYPQIDGIPSFQTRARGAAELDAQLQALETGGRDGVLDWLRDWCGAQSYRFDALHRVRTPGQASGFLADWSAFCGADDHYFLIRWACASYLCNLAFLDLMAGKRIACLASGAGHLSNLLRTVVPRPQVTVVDGNLIHLLVLKAYMAPDDQAVCAELDDPLPLPDATFDLVTMNDAFHYIDAQTDLLGEMRRILRPDGHALILHIHDPRHLEGESVPGRPVAPQDFAAMSREAGWPAPTFFAERDLARGVVAGQPPGVAAVRDPAALPPGPYAVCLSRGGEPRGRPWRFGIAAGQAIVNPVYRSRRPDRHQLDWRDSARNLAEFGDTPLPATLDADALTAAPAASLRRGILVPDPDGWLRASGSAEGAR